MTMLNLEVVREFFSDAQSRCVATLESLDGQERFSLQRIETPAGGYSQPRVLSGGKVFEKAAVQFTFSKGQRLPRAASERHPELAGHEFSATSISVIVHPWNPHVPTSHMNLRFFVVNPRDPVWYFGGGFDLTPHIPYLEDMRTWHLGARDACQSEEHYQNLKAQCDEYFLLPHRNETRGIGGIFFDDYNADGFDDCFRFIRRVAEQFLQSYSVIVERRNILEWTEDEEEWMLIRRGRYAEFNLAIDRGTKYGLQSGRRIESVLASLPPRAKWIYGFEPPSGSAQASLSSWLKSSIDFLEGVDNSVD